LTSSEPSAQKYVEEEIDIVDTESYENINFDQLNFNTLPDDRKASLQLFLKKKILKNLIDNWPDLYGKNINYDEEYNKERYFYRQCMEDLFNTSKFLIIGNKGTGKTYIYQSLKNRKIVTKLQERSNKTDNVYEFFHLVDNKNQKYQRKNKINVWINFSRDEVSNRCK